MKTATFQVTFRTASGARVTFHVEASSTLDARQIARTRIATGAGRIVAKLVSVARA